MQKLMEINIENPELLEQFPKTNFDYFIFVSEDAQDKNKLFHVHIDNIIEIGENIEGLVIWWKMWNPLEGKFITCSNHFTQYLTF